VPRDLLKEQQQKTALKAPRDLLAEQQTGQKTPRNLLQQTPTPPAQTPSRNMTDDIYSGGITGGVLDTVYGAGGAIPRAGQFITSAGGYLPNSLSEALGDSADMISNEKAQVDAGFEDTYGDSLAANLSRVGGQIAATAIPATAVTKGIGMAAPTLQSVPGLGSFLSRTASNIGASKGLTGILGAGAVEGAVQSGLTGDDPLMGAGLGALGSGVVGAVGKVARPIAEGAISPVRQGYVDLLQAMRIDNLTPGQLTGSRPLEIIDSVLANLPFSAGGAQRTADDQLEKFTTSVLSDAGVQAPRATPAVREAAEDAFGQSYDTLYGGKTINVDQDLLNDVARITSGQMSKLPSNQKEVAMAYLRDIVQAGGSMPGEAYQVARSQLGKQARSMQNSDPFTGDVLREIRNALDSAAGRSLPPGDKEALDLLNNQYRNYKSIQRATTGGNDAALEGLVSPAKLLQSVETANKGKSQAGYGDLYPAAQAGRAVLTDAVPNSGTAQRQFYQNAITGAAGAVGAGGAAYGATQDPSIGLGSTLAALASPKVLQMALNNPAARQYFTEGIPVLNKLATKTARDLGAVGAAASNKDKQVQQPPK